MFRLSVMCVAFTYAFGAAASSNDGRQPYQFMRARYRLIRTIILICSHFLITINNLLNLLTFGLYSILKKSSVFMANLQISNLRKKKRFGGGAQGRRISLCKDLP